MYVCVCMYVPVLGILASFIGRVDNILYDLFLFQQGVSVKLLGSQIMCMYVGMYACMYIYMYVWHLSWLPLRKASDKSDSSCRHCSLLRSQRRCSRDISMTYRTSYRKMLRYVCMYVCMVGMYVCMSGFICVRYKFEKEHIQAVCMFVCYFIYQSFTYVFQSMHNILNKIL